jgi:hypothetical protein
VFEAQQMTLYKAELAVAHCHWVHGGIGEMQEYLRNNGFGLNQPLDKVIPTFASKNTSVGTAVKDLSS